jgi:hypothetical protein
MAGRAGNQPRCLFDRRLRMTCDVSFYCGNALFYRPLPRTWTVGCRWSICCIIRAVACLKQSERRKHYVLSAFPKNFSAHLRQHFQAFSQSQKVIPGKLADFA